MSLRTVDLNLLPLLRALLREKSISHAAQKCSLSQSSMSDVLRRLRIALNDPLLVRVGRRMELTEHAAELIPELENLCAGLETFFRQSDFNPRISERTFVIASSDHTMFLMAPFWLAEMERAAPQVRIAFTELSDRFIDQLSTRDIDFAVLPSYAFDTIPADTLRYMPLTRDEAVVLVRKDHPLSARGRLTPEDLRAYRMICFVPSREIAEGRYPRLNSAEMSLNVAASMPHITLPPYLLPGTDYFTITSSLIAAAMSRLLPLDVLPLTSGAPGVELGLVWSPVQEENAAHRWFREMTESQVEERKRA